KGEAQISLAVLSECRARQSGNPGFIEETIRNIPARSAQRGDIGKQIKRTVRPQTVNSGNIVQAIHKYIATLAKFFDHGLDGQSGLCGKCLDGGKLAKCGCAGD